MTRPESVTVVCWVIIVVAVDSIVGGLSSFMQSALREVVGSEATLPTALKITVTAQAALVVLAICMLHGIGWARIAYLLLAFLFLVAAWYASARHSGFALTAMMVTIRTILIVTFLFRSRANAFFSRHEVSAETFVHT